MAQHVFGSLYGPFLPNGVQRSGGRPFWRRARSAAAAALLLAGLGPAQDTAAVLIGFAGQVSSPAGLQYGPGGSLVAVSGDLLEGSPLDAPLATPPVVGSFVLQSAGTGDLRSTPGTATLTTPSGNLVAVATHVNGPTLRDATTGAPLAAPAAGPGPSTAAFASICSTTLGFSSIDRSACALNVFSSTAPIASAGALSVATLFSHFFAGDPGLNAVAFSGLGATAPLPLVNLKSSAGAAGVGATLSSALTAQQQGLLGCGTLFGTNCNSNGIGPLTLSAGAVIQSFPSFLSTHLTNETGIAQPGTVGFAGGPGCMGFPGCRGTGNLGYDAAVDGNPASVGFNPQFGNPGYQTPGHPFTGQAWQNVMAGFSWNLLMVLVTTSPNWDRQALASASTTQCSYLVPQLCSAVRSYLRLVVNPLADDPNGTSPRWLWETGADYTINRASGEFAGLAGASLNAFGPFDPNGSVAGTGFLITVPEPGTSVLLGVGLAGLAAVKTRRKRV